MRPKLKEDPREWRKFALAGAAFASAIFLTLWRRGSIGAGHFQKGMFFLALVLLIALFWPRFLRPAYRGMMTLSFYAGQIMGRVILAFFFLFVLTPLAIVLRLAGKDLIRLKRNSAADTYWRTPQASEDMRRQF